MKRLLWTAVLTGLLGFAMQSSAHAQTAVAVWNNGFEGSPGSVWWAQGNAGFDVAAGFARTGSNNGWVRNTSGWNALASQGAIAVFRPGTRFQCTVTMAVRSSGNVSNFFLSLFNLDGSVYRGHQIGPLSGAQLGVWPNYKVIAFSFAEQNETSSYVPVYLRAGFWGNGQDAWVQLDDASIRCTQTFPL